MSKCIGPKGTDLLLLTWKLMIRLKRFQAKHFRCECRSIPLLYSGNFCTNDPWKSPHSWHNQTYWEHYDEPHLRMSQPGIKHSLLTPTETLVLHHHSLFKWSNHCKWSYLTYIASPETSWGDSLSLMTWKCPNLCNQWIYKKVYRQTLMTRATGTSLVVQAAGDKGSVPGWGTEVQHATTYNAPSHTKELYH